MSISKAIFDYKEWIKTKYSDKKEQAEKLRELDRINFDLKRLEASKLENASIGLYGESQAGKSFLVDSILKGKNDKLIVSVGSKNIDFKSLNPDQNAEATAVITRFVAFDENKIAKNGNYICAKLNTIGEYLHQLFYALQTSIDVDYELLNNYKFDKKPHSNTDKVSVIQAWSILEFLDEILESEFTNSVYKSNLPKLISIFEGKLINENLTLGDVERLIEYIFFPVKEICLIAKSTLPIYGKLNYEDSVLIHRELITKVLNTSTLYNYKSKDEVKFSIEKSEGLSLIQIGNNYSLPVLQLMLKEIEFICKDGHNEILKECDLIDFPGLRAFASNETKIKTGELDKVESLMLALKQGKLRYSFEHFTSNYKIQKLIVVSPWGNQNAPFLPIAIKKWYEIQSEISANPNKNLNFVFTKSDLFLSTVRSKENIEESIIARFKHQFEDYFDDKLLKQPCNLFLIRNTDASNYSIVTDKNELQNIKSIFLANKFVIKYLSTNAERTFDAIISQNGGIDMLLSHLNKQIDGAQKEKELLINEKIRTHILYFKKEVESHIIPETDEELRISLTNKAIEFNDLFLARNKIVSLIKYFDTKFLSESQVIYFLDNCKTKASEDYFGEESYFEEFIETVIQEYVALLMKDKSIYLKSIKNENEENHFSFLLEKMKIFAILKLKKDSDLESYYDVIQNTFDIEVNYNFYEIIKFKIMRVFNSLSLRIEPNNEYDFRSDQNCKNNILLKLNDIWKRNLGQVYTAVLPKIDYKENAALKKIISDIEG